MHGHNFPPVIELTQELAAEQGINVSPSTLMQLLLMAMSFFASI